MTRKSPREIERALDDLGEDADLSPRERWLFNADWDTLTEAEKQERITLACQRSNCTLAEAIKRVANGGGGT